MSKCNSSSRIVPDLKSRGHYSVPHTRFEPYFMLVFECESRLPIGSYGAAQISEPFLAVTRQIGLGVHCLDAACRCLRSCMPAFCCTRETCYFCRVGRAR